MIKLSPFDVTIRPHGVITSRATLTGNTRRGCEFLALMSTTAEPQAAVAQIDLRLDDVLHILDRVTEHGITTHIVDRFA